MGRFAFLCLALLAVKTTALVTRRESDPRLPPPKAVPYIKFIKHDDIEARWDVPRGVETQRKPGSQQLYSVQPTDGPDTIPASSVRFVSSAAPTALTTTTPREREGGSQASSNTLHSYTIHTTTPADSPPATAPKEWTHGDGW